MIYVALALIVASGLFALMRILLRDKPINLQQFFVLYALVLIGIVFIFLGLTGRLHWLFVLLGSALPFMGRIVGFGLSLWRTAGIFKSIRGLFDRLSGLSSESNGAFNGASSRDSSMGSAMTRQQALDILGLEGNPTVEEIKSAHRQLIQKLHPDRGGSTLLAKQVNEAKQVLLKDV